MNKHAIKIRVTKKNLRHTHLSIFESTNGGINWMKCGELVCDPDIAALLSDVMFRGRGRWDLTWEDKSE